VIKFSTSTFFDIFVHNRSFLDILPNFNLLSPIEPTFFGPLIPRINGRHKFPLFQVLVDNWRKLRHFLKNTTRVANIITSSAENCTNVRAKVLVVLYANCSSNCYYNFNPCGVFEKKTSLANERARISAVIVKLRFARENLIP